MADAVPPGDRTVPAGGEGLIGDLAPAAPPPPNCAVPSGDPKLAPLLPTPPVPMPPDLDGGDAAPYGEPERQDALPIGLVAEPPKAPELPKQFAGDPPNPLAGELKPPPTGLDGDEPRDVPPPKPDFKPLPIGKPKPPLLEDGGCHPRISGLATSWERSFEILSSSISISFKGSMSWAR